MTAYDDTFYETQSGGSYASAKLVIPYVLEILPIGSVCDVGCGVGSWLRAWSEAGVAEIAGFDGAYAMPMLQIPKEHFTPTDLNQPVRMARRFDLAMSVEVAEHLEPRRSESFVADLVRLAPLVMFSAAVPNQGGMEHINERWQDEWVEMFAAHGYRACDVIRPQIWRDRRIEPWYRQNILLFADAATIERYPALTRQYPFPVSVMHPEQVRRYIDLAKFSNIARVLYWKLRRDFLNLTKGPRRS